MKTYTHFLVLLLSSSSFANDDLFEASLEDIMSMESEMTAEVGSRSGSTNAIHSSVAIDVITHQQIENSGLSSLVDVLRYFVPGFNAPQSSLSDGSDHIRLFTLRGMSPDQVLVLLNGKRLHSSSLLHVNGTIGRGSSSVDLDTIALASIDKVEILRDGAAAQYGSDAIAGVINIILKRMDQKNTVTIQGGAYKEGDGEQLYASTFVSSPLKYDGFINLTLSAKGQKQTNRAGEDRRVDPAEIHSHYGIPDSQSYNAVLNLEVPQKNNLNFYLNGILNYRESEASAFFRTPDETNPIYPDGFLPLINTKIFDFSSTLGIKNETNGFIWDLSNTIAYNEINYYVNDSMNKSLGSASPTSFNNGTLSSVQNTTNLDIHKNINNLKLAGGLEYRYENYQIQKGDTASYIRGDIPTSGGSQGFAGYGPENETDVSRNSFALYLDAKYNFTDNLQIEGAGRYENFSDFGQTTNFKLALSYKLSPDLLLRTSASTGFRAPSLSQSYYSQTSYFYDSVKDETLSSGIYRVNHEASEVFGATDLEAESSQHFAIGSVYEVNNFSMIIDYFYIQVDNKILLSDKQNATNQTEQDVLDKYNISTLSFFTNAVNTQTDGIDLKFNYNYDFADSAKLNVGVWYNYANNKVTAFNTSTLSMENSYKEIDKIENGQPKHNLKILTHYQLKKFNTSLNISRYGKYQQVVEDTAYEFSPQWTTDLEVSYKASQSILLAVGGHNIFDTHPDKWDGLNGIGFGSDGILPYSIYAPSGVSGAFYYIKAKMEF